MPCACSLATSVFFFVHNIDVSAEDYKPSCHSLFKSYSCDTVDAACTFGSSGKLYMSGLDRKTTDVIFTIQSHNIVILLKKSKREKGVSGTGGILELNRFEKINQQ